MGGMLSLVELRLFVQGLNFSRLILLLLTLLLSACGQASPLPPVQAQGTVRQGGHITSTPDFWNIGLEVLNVQGEGPQAYREEFHFNSVVLTRYFTWSIDTTDCDIVLVAWLGNDYFPLRAGMPISGTQTLMDGNPLPDLMLRSVAISIASTRPCRVEVQAQGH